MRLVAFAFIVVSACMPALAAGCARSTLAPSDPPSTPECDRPLVTDAANERTPPLDAGRDSRIANADDASRGPYCLIGSGLCHPERE